MCGIAATARLDGERLEPSRAQDLLDGLADVLDHRGPDARQTRLEGSVGIAFTRLSLVDPSNGDQPFVSEDGAIVLVANGEVYNHHALAGAMPDARLITGSDCEVLVPLYQRRGMDFLDDVQGMFAIIAWDRIRNQLVLARDRFGIKPLYFHRNENRIVASSEIKALFLDPETPRSLDWARSLATPSLAAAPGFNEDQACTWFEGIESVPPGHVLRIDLETGSTERHQYWQLPVPAEELGTEDELVEEYGALLRDAVRDCATSDTELGLFLSGGIDSSAVLALAADQLPDIHTFSVLSAATIANGDAEASVRCAEHFGVPHHLVSFDDDLVPTPGEWRRLLWLTETPMCGPEVYYKHELHRFARETRPELRGMLLGAASDEFNGGYSVDVASGGEWADFEANLATMARSTDLRSSPLTAPWSLDGRPIVTGGAPLRSADEPYVRYLRSEHRKIEQYNVWHEDRTAAGSGVEARVPFLDHRLVELLARIPASMRPALLWDKQILRRAMATVLPTALAQRPKVPFFYGPGTAHTYTMLTRMLAAEDGELVERALAAPGADEWLDADAVRASARDLRGRSSDEPAVELLLRVVNLGLLSELVVEQPVLEKMSAGPVREVATDLSVLPDAVAQPDAVPVLALAASVLLVASREGEPRTFLAVDGSFEYELDAAAPITRLLAHLSVPTALDAALAASEVARDEVAQDLAELIRQGVVVRQ